MSGSHRDGDTAIGQAYRRQRQVSVAPRRLLPSAGEGGFGGEQALIGLADRLGVFFRAEKWRGEPYKG